jgi:hypothetical protein
LDRQTVYPGQIPLETDLLNTNKNMLIALGFLAQDILGVNTLVSGLACTPNSPAALNVLVAPGRIYALENMDATAYSSLAADLVHSLVKQGISLDTTTLACAAPGTVGYSVSYLIQAAFSEVDANPVALPYYNASNPAQPYSGPNNSGTAQNTTRKGTIVLTAKAGVAAATGTQTTPAADAGNVGLWVVTVAYGQTQIIAGNIAQASGAPFIANTLTLLAPLVSPAFTGYPTAPTPATSDVSTKLATTEFVAGHVPAQATTAAKGIVELATNAEAVTGTDTERAVTPAGLAAALSAGGSSVDELYIDAGAMTPAITAGAALAVVEDGTNDLTRNVMSFQGSTADTSAAMNFRLPSNWDRGTVKAKVLWTPAAGASAGDNVRFGLAGVAVSDDDALDVALGTAVTIDDTVIAVGDLHVSAASAALTIGGTPQVGDYIRLVLTRDYDYGASPMSEAAQVLGIVLQYGITGSIAAW